jgi:hypothetical protein
MKCWQSVQLDESIGSKHNLELFIFLYRNLQRMRCLNFDKVKGFLLIFQTLWLSICSGGFDFAIQTQNLDENLVTARTKLFNIRSAQCQFQCQPAELEQLHVWLCRTLHYVIMAGGMPTYEEDTNSATSSV